MSSVCPSPPRLASLTKWDNFPGYGFNLHAEKARAGQFIGAIDPGSPAEAAGLREGDRIVEVNGVNVGQENHKQVVGRIRASSSTCSLLVADTECSDWHTARGVVIRSSLPYTLVYTSNHTKEEEYYDDDEEELDLRLRRLSMEEEKEREDEEENEEEEEVEEEEDSTVSLSRQESTSASETSTDSATSSTSYSLSSCTSPTSSTPSSSTLAKKGSPLPPGLQLDMSAREMRALLTQRRRRDPRTEPERVDWWQRHQIVQTL